MSYTKVEKRVVSENPLKFKPWTKWKQKDFVMGKYVGNSVDKYGKQNYHIEVLDVKFADKDVKVGDTLVINSNGALAYKMKEFSYDDVLGFTYNGKKLTDAKSKYPGKEFHDVEVDQYQSETESDDVL